MPEDDQAGVRAYIERFRAKAGFPALPAHRLDELVNAIAGDPAGGTEPLVQALSEGRTLSRREQIVVLWESGKREEAERRALDAAAAGEPMALRDLINHHRRAADRERKEELARMAADHGDHQPLRTIAYRYERGGNGRRAAQLYQQGLERGDQQAGAELARLKRALRGID
ncbi:hypothetical protein [Mycobacterium sp. URHD0025]|uniref:hypothetical protein n=1 Tax=Mycobacterium sp. URHD0025 TaxID=1298864 RepID=UPI00041C454E|nr:hypothetical protein [Mycobacterium sp. URHD0025]